MKWNDTLTMIVRDLMSRKSQVATTHSEIESSEAVYAGLLIYSDMGGSSFLTPDGRILEYDAEARRVSEISDERTVDLVMCIAARRFPELAALWPSRPEDGIVCPACKGSGFLMDLAYCQYCSARGWVSST